LAAGKASIVVQIYEFWQERRLAATTGCGRQGEPQAVVFTAMSLMDEAGGV
jgi:hypothetical protein